MLKILCLIGKKHNHYITIETEGSETLSAGTRTGASTLVFGSHVGTAVHLFTDGSNWYDIIQNCTPNFINQEVLEYDYQGELSFLAGNEYRDFDIKSLRYYAQ